MKARTMIGAAVMCGVVLAPTLVLAQESCISQKRIYSTQAVDNRTILITDWSRNQYTLHMRGVCGGMWKGTTALGFRLQGGELACIRRGDAISYPLAPDSHRVTCYVDSVTAGEPAAPGT